MFILSWVVLSVSTPVGLVSNVLELCSSGRMFDRKWNWPESLAGLRLPLPLPTHAKLCQVTAQPRPPWENQSLTSSGKWRLGFHFPAVVPKKKSLTHIYCTYCDLLHFPDPSTTGRMHQKSQIERCRSVWQRLIWISPCIWGQRGCKKFKRLLTSKTERW